MNIFRRQQWHGSGKCRNHFFVPSHFFRVTTLRVEKLDTLHVYQRIISLSLSFYICLFVCLSECFPVCVYLSVFIFFVCYVTFCVLSLFLWFCFIQLITSSYFPSSCFKNSFPFIFLFVCVPITFLSLYLLQFESG